MNKANATHVEGKDALIVTDADVRAALRVPRTPMQFATKETQHEDMRLVLECFARRKSAPNWLLRESGAIDTNNGLSLEREITVDVKKRAKKTPVRRVSIAQPLVSKVERDDALSVRTKRETFRPVGLGIDILKRLMTDDLLPNGFDFSKIAGDDQVFVEISVGYKGRHNDEYDKALRSIVAASKHVDEDDLRIEFDGSSRAHRGQLFVGAPVGIRHVNGLPDPEDVWAKMHEQMKQWLDENQV